MAKFLVFSDTHIGASRYSLPWFGEELRLAMTDLVQKAKDLEVDGILHCGDLFDSPTVTTSDIVFVIRLLQSISDLPFVTIVGNHDLQPSKPLDDSPISIIDEACPNFKVLHNNNISLLMNDINIIGISYIPPNMFLNRSQNTSVLEPYYDYLDTSTTNLALIHQDISLLDYAKFIPNALTGKDIEPFDFVLAGHYHNRVESDKFLYVGSTYPLAFKQAYEQKGAYLLTINDKGLSYEFIPVDKVKHKFIEIVINFEEFTEDILQKYIDEGYDVIRIKFIVKEKQMTLASTLAKELRVKYQKQLEKLVVDYDPIEYQTVKSDTIAHSSASTEDIVLSFIEHVVKNYDKDTSESIVRMLNKLINFNSQYKSESKQLDQAVKTLSQLL